MFKCSVKVHSKTVVERIAKAQHVTIIVYKTYGHASRNQTPVHMFLYTKHC